MRRGYDRSTSLVLGLLFGIPIALALPSVLRLMGIFGWIIAILGGLALLLAIPMLLLKWSRKRERKKRQMAIREKAIGHRPDPCVADSASSMEAPMTHDTRFALIDTDGDERFAAIIDGTFQIGKAKDDTPSDIEKFAHAILVDGRDGRFVCADGRKPALLKFIGRPRAVIGYRVTTEIAAKLDIPPIGSR